MTTPENAAELLGLAELDAIANAIEQAQCPGPEGPFGGYDYGHRNPEPVEGGRYVVRDFRDPRSSDWGRWVHQTDDLEAHERAFALMTRRHIALAAQTVVLAQKETSNDQ